MVETSWRTALSVVLLLSGIYAVNAAVCLYRNYRIGRRSNFPVIVMPAYELNPFFLIYSAFNKKIVATLPFGLSKWPYLNFWNIDWAFHTRGKLFKEYGDCVLLVNPGGRSLFVADRDVALQIYSRRQDFPKDTRLYDWVRFYGNNVLTTEGKEWAKHRKITGPPFNETINASVWNETIFQALNMQHAWLYQNEANGSVKVNKDFCTVARNVITAAGFGVRLPFETAEVLPGNYKPNDVLQGHQFDTRFTLHSVPDNHKMSFGESLDTLLDNVLTLVLAPKFALKYGPAVIRKTGTAYDELGLYLQELLERERQRDKPSNMLIGALVESASSSNPSGGSVLNDEEVMGNIFLFALAGMETTAGTLQYILILLALHPQAQAWMKIELNKELEGLSKDPLSWDFEQVFPRLVSPLCVIYETLRIFGTHQYIPKWTADKAQTVNYKGSVCHVEPETTVYVCIRGLHDNENYWGSKTHGFHPEAWDARNPDSGWEPAMREKPTSQEKAPFCHIRAPLKGAYSPFSDGVRSCLGRVFSIVEMTAILAVLFQGPYRVEIARKGKESQEEANSRAWTALNSSSQTNTLMIRQDIEVTWIKESSGKW